jgi:predicted amidohydrolase
MSSIRIGFSYDAAWLVRGRVPVEAKGVDVLVFPELVDGGYAALAAGALPHRSGDAYLERFRKLTGPRLPACVAGTVLTEDRSGRRTNTAHVFFRGRLRHRFAKIHLFRPGNDDRYFGAGRRVGAWTLPLQNVKLRAAGIVCFDLRFPELIRVLALRGIQLLVVPARWPVARDQIWRSLLKVRAIENQIFVVGCNATGKEGGFSYAFDPFGVEIFSSRRMRTRPVQAFDIDLARIADARRHHDNLREAVLLNHSTIPPLLRSSRSLR